MLSVRTRLVPGANPAVPALGIRAQSAMVSNPTNQWWNIGPGIQVAPYTIAIVQPLQSATQSPTITCIAPGGITQGVPIASEEGYVQFSDEQLAPSSGIPVSPNTPPTTALAVVATSLVAPGLPSIVTIPAGAQPGDTLVAFLLGFNGGSNAAVALGALPAGWTTQSAFGTQNGAANRYLLTACLTAPFTQPGTVTFTWNGNTTAALAVIVVVRNANALLPVVGAQFSPQVTAATAIVVNGASTAQAGEVAFYLVGSASAAAVPLASITPGAGIVQDVIDGVTAALEMQLAHLVLTASGTAPQETFTFSGAGFSVMAAGLAVNLSL